MEAAEKQVVLSIADISGYTQFMLAHQKALKHSQIIVSELLSRLIECAKPPLNVAKLEGDAVFLYTIIHYRTLFIGSPTSRWGWTCPHSGSRRGVEGRVETAPDHIGLLDG